MAEGKYVGTGADRRWQNSDGTYMYEKPGGGRQTLSAITELFLPGIQGVVHNSNPYRTNPVRPSQADREPTVSAGQESTAERIKRREAAGLRNHREGGGNQNRSGITPIDGSYRKAVEAGPDGKITPGTLPPSVKTPTPNPTPTPTPEITGPIPESTRVNKNGVVQKGTDMSRSFNDLLGGVGQVPYSSNQLPTTQSNPFSATPSQTPGFPTDTPDIGGYNGATYDSETGRQAAGSRDLSQFSPITGKEQQIAGAAQRTGAGTLSEALSDTAGINSYMSKFSSGDRERAANRAFMDTEDSMDALRAKEAVNGVVFAQNQHYMSGESGDDQAIAINRGQARDISNGKSTAQSLLAAHIDKNKNAATPVEAQEPPTIEKPGVKQSFGRTETISAPIDTTILDTTAFNINNGVDVPSFENKGGYKPTGKKPEVDYSKIFS